MIRPFPFDTVAPRGFGEPVRGTTNDAPAVDLSGLFNDAVRRTANFAPGQVATFPPTTGQGVSILDTRNPQIDWDVPVVSRRYYTEEEAQTIEREQQLGVRRTAQVCIENMLQQGIRTQRQIELTSRYYEEMPREESFEEYVRRVDPQLYREVYETEDS